MTKRLLRLKRTWLAVIGAASLTTGLLAFVAPSTSSADNASGCDFAAVGTTESCLGSLTGSTFAGGDGNLLTNPTTFGTTDWQNVTGLNPGFDLPSGKPDNSFGQGTKEDNPAVTVVNGSIPPNKSDLSRFYEASEFSSVNNHNFLYLGWERTNSLGTANFDFEINQKTQPDLTVAGAATLVRTPGDLLVTYDFTNGGGKPSIGLLRWLTSATVPVVPNFATNVCFSSNTFPCWGDQLTLDGTDSIAAVNNLDSVTDPLFPGQPNAQPSVPANQFGETAIDLTKAGVFPPGTCEAFGSAFVRSRSSASFTAEIKDFIAPIPVNISNCGTIKIVKHSDPRGVNQVFNYTSNLPAEPPGTVNGVPQGGVTCPGNASAGVQSDGSFCLNDAGNGAGGDSAGNTVYNNALQAGTYTVTEGTEPNGFTFEKLSCDGGTTSTSGETATINLKPGDSVVCTYVNQQNTATLKTLVSNAGPVFPSQSVGDTATVTGNQAADTPSGTVTFFLCGPIPTGACSSGGTNIGTGTLSGSAGVASANSPNVNTSASPLAPGRYCFRAEWPGDNNYPPSLTEFGGATGTNECFTVQTIATTTVTTPSVGSGGNTTFGASVTDTALVSAVASGGGTPTGTVTFFVCTPTQVTANGGTCSSSGTQVGSAVQTTAVAGSNPPQSTATSSGVTANATGTWCFRGVYTPGGANGANYTGSSDASTDECFTVTDTTTSTSNQNWLPNDTGSVSSKNGAPLNGTLSAQLFTSGDCSGSPVSGQLYSTTLNGTSSMGTVTTTNKTFLVSASTAVSWLVKFTSSDSNVAGSMHCESTSLTINN
jgi:hypothetical protein